MNSNRQVFMVILKTIRMSGHTGEFYRCRGHAGIVGFEMNA